MNWDKVYLVLFGLVVFFGAVGALVRTLHGIGIPEVISAYHVVGLWMALFLAFVGGMFVAFGLADE